MYDAQPYSRVIQETFDQQNMIASLTGLSARLALCWRRLDFMA